MQFGNVQSKLYHENLIKAERITCLFKNLMTHKSQIRCVVLYKTLFLIKRRDGDVQMRVDFFLIVTYIYTRVTLLFTKKILLVSAHLNH